MGRLVALEESGACGITKCHACYVMRMAKVSKTISLPYEVAVELEDREDNQSEKVEQLLRDEYDL